VAKACLGIDDVIFLAREWLGRRLMMSGSGKQQREKRMARVFDKGAADAFLTYILWLFCTRYTVHGIELFLAIPTPHIPTHVCGLLGPTRLRSILPTPLAEMSSVPNFDSIDT